EKYTPLQQGTNQAKEDHPVTQFEGKHVETLGLLKMDFLGLKNLTILQNVIEFIKAKYEKEYNLDEIPLDDKKTLKLFAKGETTGVFQFESDGFKRYLKELKPSRFQDLIDMVALYRPGPMDWIPDYIAGKHGKRKITYLHPKLKPILEKTYGIIVVQEQVMEIAKQLAGFSAGEADFLRKAMGKKIKSMMDEQREKFIMGCINNKIKGKTAEKIWDFIKPFAGYGFNWAHSACYAMIGYQTAYFKAHYPVEFMAALLSSDENNIDRISVEIEECRKMKIPVLPPDVNESFARFSSIGKGKEKFIRYGLNAIKNVGENLVKSIIKERKANGKFKNMGDFIERIEDKDLNKKSLESLCKAGALNSIASAEEVLANIDKILNYSKEIKTVKKQGQSSLFGEISSDDGNRENNFGLVLKDQIKIDKKEKLRWEKELLGIYVTDNPLLAYRKFLEKYTTDILTLEEKYKHNRQMRIQSSKVGGQLIRVKKIFTKNNQEMAFAELEDLKGKLELIIFPKIFQKYHDLLIEDRFIWAEGKLNDKDGSLKILVDKMGKITEKMNKEASKLGKIEAVRNPDATIQHSAKNSNLRELIIKLDLTKNDSRNLKAKIRQLKPGNGKIILKAKDENGKIIKIRIKGNYQLRGSVFESLKQEYSNI
ncbi:MAG: DNA polymerase III subunit alpha, partial [Candidatus Moranbacteria bacterium]|nr:DNA polymerase III subunit alpha [Candidatus Moranbacteria bacterium]